MLGICHVGAMGNWQTLLPPFHTVARYLRVLSCCKASTLSPMAVHVFLLPAFVLWPGYTGFAHACFLDFFVIQSCFKQGQNIFHGCYRVEFAHCYFYDHFCFHGSGEAILGTPKYFSMHFVLLCFAQGFSLQKICNTDVQHRYATQICNTDMQ